MSIIQSYYDFHYCLWLSPEDNHPWYDYTNGYQPHLTIYYYLTKDAAILALKKLRSNFQSISVRIVGDPVVSLDETFHAVYFNIEIIGDSIPDWFPENAHISFSYKYHQRFTPEEVEKIREKIKIKDAILDKLQITCCNGHFHSWIPEKDDI